MPTSRLERTLAELRSIRANPTTPEAHRLLRQVLRSTSSHAIAQAATLVAEATLDQHIPALEAAFDRFLGNGTQRDKGCHAKAAIADTLYQMNHDNAELYLRGIRHIQMEPVWGGQADTATKLRAMCGMALVRMNYPDVLNELALSLADPENPVRLAAAEALGYYGLADAAPLLRLKIAIGDTDPEVTAACLSALLRVDAITGLPFVATLLRHKDQGLAETAALALGESRLAEAFALLQDWWGEQLTPSGSRTALLALAMLRSEESLLFLQALVAQTEPTTARQTLDVLSMYKHDAALRQQLAQIVAERGNGNLQQFFAQSFNV